MNITPTRLAPCKAYMRVEHEADDVLITALMTAAAAYLSDAGVPEPSGTDAFYNLALWGLTLHWYDHRDDVAAALALPASLRLQINTAKLHAAAAAAAAAMGT